jgi:transcriptional regulator with XRE-family HTH domain
MPSELWQRVRAARKSAGLTQEELGQRIGVTRASVSQWEHHDAARRTVPRWEHIASVSAVTGAPQDWLMSDDSDLESFWFSNADDDSEDGGANKHDQRSAPSIRQAGGDLGVWSAFVVVPRLDPEWTRDARRSLSQNSLGLLAYKRSWIDYKQLDPATLYTWVATDDEMIACGIRRGDMLLIDIGQRALNVQDGLYLVGAGRRLLRLELGLDGRAILHTCPVTGTRYEAEVSPAIEGAVIGRAILHTHEL